MAIGIRTLLVATFLLMMSLKAKSIVTPDPVPTQPPVRFPSDSPPVRFPTDGNNQQVPCFFVLGDSLTDSGNNNNLPTLAKANYQPYGVDFPGGVPTGRFTNNRTYIDVLTELLGFDRYIPPFNQNMSLAEASQGVNYASGGAGILYESSRQNLGEVISFYEQIQNHRTIVARVGNQVDLNRCLYTINIGSNDYINNYFNNQSYPTSQVFSPTQFASYLIAYYRNYVKILHDLGARKIALSLLTQIGCSLGEIAAFGATGCVESVNSAVDIFNTQLVSLVTQLNQELTDAKFIYLNSSAIESSAYTGVTVVDSSCCTPRSDGQCEPQSTPCPNRGQYYFWDLFHPTDAVHKVLGERAYRAQNTNEAVPYDIRTLARL